MKIIFLKCGIDSSAIEQVLDRIKHQIKIKKPLSHICLNVDSVVRANRDAEYLKIINESGLVTLDGMPLVMLSRLAMLGVYEKVSGPDLFDQLLVLAQKNKWKISFVGGEETVIGKVRERIKEEFPEMKVGFSHNGYWANKDEKKIIAGIARSKSDILFVALGAPKQDWFICKNLEKFKVSFALGVGGCFDIFAGHRKRAPKFIQNIGFEWFYRFIQEPRRLFKRYFIDDISIIPLVLREVLFHFFRKGHKRSLLIKKNVAWSIVLQAAAMALSLVAVPLTLKYLGKTNYGIILTLASLVGWLALLDFGFAQGLRNRLSEALSRKQNKLARSYVSTAYIGLGLISASVLLIFFVINHYINWPLILGTPANLTNEIRILAYFIISASCLQFWLNLIFTIVAADQKPAYGTLISFICSLLVIIGILILVLTTPGNLLRYGLILFWIPAIVYLTSNLIFFSGRYKFLAPSFKLFNLKYVNKLLRLGTRFFVINLAMIIVFQTDYLIILHILGPSEVVIYNIAYKYFGLTTAFFALIVMPFWSAVTEAYAKKDFDWIINAQRNLKKTYLIIFCFSLAMLAISPWFIKLWLHGEIIVPFGLLVAMFVYTQLLNWGSIFVIFINGIGNIKLQFITSIIGAIINIPLSIFLAKNLHLGSTGVIIATTICVVYGYGIAPFQLKRLILRKNSK